MEILFAKSFNKDIDVIQHNQEVKKRLLEMINKLKGIDYLDELQGIKKIEGYTSYYRIRIGDYRMGIKKTGRDFGGDSLFTPKRNLQALSIK